MACATADTCAQRARRRRCEPKSVDIIAMGWSAGRADRQKGEQKDEESRVVPGPLVLGLCGGFGGEVFVIRVNFHS